MVKIEMNDVKGHEKSHAVLVAMRGERQCETNRMEQIQEQTVNELDHDGNCRNAKERDLNVNGKAENDNNFKEKATKKKKLTLKVDPDQRVIPLKTISDIRAEMNRDVNSNGSSSVSPNGEALNLAGKPGDKGVSKDPWSVFNGGFTRLLNQDWGERSTSFRKMSFVLALLGLILYFLDVGSDMYAVYKYLVEMEKDQTDFVLLIFHTQPLDSIEQKCKSFEDFHNYSVIFPQKLRDHFVIHMPQTCDVLGHFLKDCSEIEFNLTDSETYCDMLWKNAEQQAHSLDDQRLIMFEDYENKSGFHFFQVESLESKNGFSNQEDRPEFVLFEQADADDFQAGKIQGSLFVFHVECKWTRKRWALVTSLIIFAPGLLGFFKLMIEERKCGSSVSWCKKLLLLFGFPFLGLYTKVLRLLYHDSEEFDQIEYSMTSAEVLAESIPQFLVQHFVFLNEIRQFSFGDVYAPFIAMCLSVTSIILFYIMNTVKICRACWQFRQWSYWRRRPLGFLTYLCRSVLSKSCLGLVHLVLVFSIADFYIHAHSHTDFCYLAQLSWFTEYCAFCFGLALALGLFRTLILMIITCRTEDNISRSAHALYLPIVLGPDHTEYLRSTTKRRGTRLAVEWAMGVTLIVALNLYCYAYQNHLVLPGLAWEERFYNDRKHFKHSTDS